MRERILQGSLTFLGFVISVLAILYFTFEYLPQVGEWTQVAALVLLAFAFAFAGVYLGHTVVGEPFFPGTRLEWLRPANVLYVLAIITGIAAHIRFLNVDGIETPVKILVSLVVGIGLIVAMARRRTKQMEEPETPQ